MTNNTSAGCMKAYALNLVSKVRNVLLITRDLNTTSNEQKYGLADSSVDIPYAWICGSEWSPYAFKHLKPACTLSTALAAVDTWTVNERRISYCMVEEVKEKCKLSFSVGIMVVVIAANAAKSAIMILTFLRLKEPTLVTIGDAMASFLEVPDPTTAGLCLSTRNSTFKKPKSTNNREQGRNPNRKRAKRWLPKRHFWFQTASKTRWLDCNML